MGLIEASQGEAVVARAGVRLKSRRQTAVPSLEAVDAVVPLAAVDAVDALAAVDAVVALAAVEAHPYLDGFDGSESGGSVGCAGRCIGKSRGFSCRASGFVEVLCKWLCYFHAIAVCSRYPPYRPQA